MEIKEQLKTILIQALGVNDLTEADIVDDAILFGPQSAYDFDSIDAVTFLSDLRETFQVPMETRIGVEDILTIEKTVLTIEKNRTVRG